MQWCKEALEKRSASAPDEVTGEVERGKHAEQVLRILDAVLRDSRHYDGVKFKATVARIELLSPDLGEQGPEVLAGIERLLAVRANPCGSCGRVRE